MGGRVGKETPQPRPTNAHYGPVSSDLCPPLLTMEGGVKGEKKEVKRGKRRTRSLAVQLLGLVSRFDTSTTLVESKKKKRKGRGEGRYGPPAPIVRHHVQIYHGREGEGKGGKGEGERGDRRCARIRQLLLFRVVGTVYLTSQKKKGRAGEKEKKKRKIQTRALRFAHYNTSERG